MDKYAVDLDQVLNDFEYSELTDHYSVGAPAPPLNNARTPPAPKPHELYRNPPVKHTINNVFESLNEYLNTDIGAKPKQTSSKEDKKEVQSIFISNDLAVEKSEVRGGFPVLDEKAAAKSQEKVINELVECLGDLKVENVDVNNTRNETVEEETEKTRIDPDVDSKEVEGIQCDTETVAKQPLVDICENVANVTTESQPEETFETPEQIPTHTPPPPQPEELNNQHPDPVSFTETLPADKETTIYSEAAVEGPEPVGFDENFQMDDSELSKYLEELENEYEAKEDKLQSETASNEVSVKEEETEQEDSSTLSRPNSLQFSQAQIDLVGEPGSTPYNNMYVSNTLPKPTESDTDSSSSVSPSFSDVSTDTAGSTATTESVNDSVNEKIKPDDPNPADAVIALENATNNNPEDSSNENIETVVNVANDDDDKGGAGERADVPESAPPPPVEESRTEQSSGPSSWLGKQAPLWIPDSEALNCLHCDSKFTVIKRRHHCRACGLVLCSKCCNMRLRLEYLDAEARVCLRCHDILSRDTNSSSGSEVSASVSNSPSHMSQPNPNNPMEYCSMVPPLQQVGTTSQNPPSVMVPVGVLKRKGSSKSRTNKSVMFCDGIRPGSELTNLDNDFNYNEARNKKGCSPPPVKINRDASVFDSVTKSYIPNAENGLPPTVTIFKSDITYSECSNNTSVVEMLKNEMLTFALQSNLLVHLKIINMDCCINKWAWCFTTEGMITVGQDEVVMLLEFIDNEKVVPKDMFFHLNNIYSEAKKGSSITEYGVSLHNTTNFLDSKNHIGFLYIRPSFQCLQNVVLPKEPYLIGILIHRWEMPWAKIFPLRLVLRLGAEYRYYPSPIISTRQRESVFVEIGHTIINLLADFRNFSYTLPNIRGLTIHMEEKNTTVTIPSNRYDQVMKTLNNSSDHILAFGGNFSVEADSHLVCIQDTHGNNENTYTTHAINIQNRPRKVTGASFIVFNGALKSSSGLTAKSSIVEDGLMIQIPAEHMVQIRESLRNMKNHTIQCGCINAASDETVNINWGENDVNFNTRVQSSIDNQPLSGVPSIRVHNGKDFVCNSGNRLIRWTEVFILQDGDENARGQDVDFSKLAENISKATCQALVKYLDLLTSNNFHKIGIRTTLHVENVSYSAGSNGMKLPPIYMKSLDNELIPVLHRITSNNLGESAIVLELVFRILNV